MCNLYRALTNYKVGCVLIFIALINLPQCESKVLKVTEGEQARLDFPYLCDSTVVTLQHGNARPFYRSANPHYMSLPSNQNLVNYTKTGLNQCFLNLTINPVSRNDEGTYILTAYKNGAMLPDYPRIYLDVDYPPGKASCEISNDYNDVEWVSLRCAAQVGTLPGMIVCYQNDMRLPKGNELRESDGNLNQIILARLDGMVYCCSSFLTGMTDKCDCTDWGWDPMSDSVSDIADPCTQVISTEDPTSTHIVTIDNTNSSPTPNLVKASANYPKNHKNTSYMIVICTLSVVILILIIIILCITHIYRCIVRKLAHQNGSTTPKSKEPCLPVKDDNIPEHYGSIV